MEKNTECAPRLCEIYFPVKMGFFDPERVIETLSGYGQLLIVFSICCCWVAVRLLFTEGEQEGNSNPERSQQEESK
jgi:hypothetical protein